MRLLGGWFVFDWSEAAMLVSLLPSLIHVRGAARLSQLVEFVGEEASDEKPGRDFALTRLVELLLIEALRSTSNASASPGLLRGLADARLAPALRQMHDDIAGSWTVNCLSRIAALSRSAFFERFTRTVGVPQSSIRGSCLATVRWGVMIRALRNATRYRRPSSLSRTA